MSATSYQTITLNGINYKLVPIDEKFTYTVKDIVSMTGLSIHTIYKKIPTLELGTHYFKPNGGKLLFDVSVVDFLKQEGAKSEVIKRNDKHKSRQSVSVDQFISQWK